jgi:hypothetical protein
MFWGKFEKQWWVGPLKDGKVVVGVSLRDGEVVVGVSP